MDKKKPHYILHVQYARGGRPWWRVEITQGVFTGWYRTPARAFERICMYLNRAPI